MILVHSRTAYGIASATEELSLHAARQPFQLPKELTVARYTPESSGKHHCVYDAGCCLQMLLYSYTGQEDIRVGTLRCQPAASETEALIGLFANLVILRTPWAESTFGQVLQRVRNTTLDAYAHQELPSSISHVY